MYRCMIKDPCARMCKESENCNGCGFEQKEAERRKEIPLGKEPVPVCVPFTDWDTGKTEYKAFIVHRKAIT